jgi:pimeloyl-ACP methyl ester carboxylesterase
MSAKVCFQLNPRVQAMDFNPAWRLTTSIPSNFDLNSGTRYDQALLVALKFSFSQRMTLMSEVPYSHHTASVNDTTIHYLTAGDRSNPAVVLLHGFTQTSHMWTKDVIPALAKRYFVIAPDLRGSGDSGKPSEGYDKRTLASDVHEVVKGLGIAKILLVGHDFGAAVAYAYAAEHRSEVTRLVIYEMLMPGFGYEDALGSHPFAKDGQGRQIWHLAFHDAPHAIQEFLIRGRERKYLDFYWDTFAYNPRSVSESERREYARGYEGPGGLNALKYYQNHWIDAEHNREFAKKPLTMPVLAFGGSAFSGDMVEKGMRALATDIRGGVIPDCGHWLTAEKPDFIVKQLIDFFGESNTPAEARKPSKVSA